MDRCLALLALVSLLVVSQGACGSGATAVQDSTDGCSSDQVSCGSCANAGAPSCTICCPSAQPFWCVDGSGNALCYASESDASGACLSQVNSCH
jgi:hypothetical protein